MPLHTAIIHQIDKKPDGSAAELRLASQPLAASEALEFLLADLNDSYNARTTKVWGLFQPDQQQYPFSQWLAGWLDGQQDFIAFSQQSAERLHGLLAEVSMALGGHLLIAHYRQGMSDFLLLALLQHSSGSRIDSSLTLQAVRHLDLAQLQQAARINLSEWRNNPASKQYISLLKGRSGKKADPFAEFLGAVEGVDAAGETRTLLKAFSDYVESADLAEEQAREKTETLIDYAGSQARLGQPITLEELSGLLDEEQPRAFYDHIRNSDYGLSPEIPADRRTLNQFRRFTGRGDGLSISFDAHLLGSAIEYDADKGVLIIRQLPGRLKDQLKQSQD